MRDWEYLAKLAERLADLMPNESKRLKEIASNMEDTYYELLNERDRINA